MTLNRSTAVHPKVYTVWRPHLVSLHIQKMLLPRFGERNEGEDASVMGKAGLIIHAPRVNVRVLERDASVTEREQEKESSLSSCGGPSKE